MWRLRATSILNRYVVNKKHDHIRLLIVLSEVINMTLVLTEISPFGISMAADSAVTIRNMQNGLLPVQPNSALKLHLIPYLDAGIYCWGIGRIRNKSTDS